MVNYLYMLKSIINLSVIIRNSSEGAVWRSAWKNLSKLNPDIMPNPLGDETLELSPEAIISIFCTSESVEARPVMLPFLMARHPVIQNYPDFVKSLNQKPDLFRQYSSLVGQFAFFTLIIGYLRSISPGYPHEKLIFNLPNSPWKDLTNIKEVPLGIEKILIERTRGNLLKELSLHIPSKSDAILKALLTISSELQNEPAFVKLDTAVRNISKNENLTTELVNSKNYFEKRLGEMSQTQEPPYIRNNKISNLATQIYQKKGGKILEYVTAYLEFEELIEKIYWILTQFVIREGISCLSVTDATQLQQVMLGNSPNPILTGISRANARSLAIGQLVYLSLSDVQDHFSGLYQVNHVQALYKAGSGIRYYFKANLCWQTPLESFAKLLEIYNSQDFLIKRESITSPDNFRIEISSPQGDPISLELGDPILNFSFSKTMFLPY